MESIPYIEPSTITKVNWDLKAEDGALLQSGLVFHLDGTIANGTHPNETSWRYESGFLIIYHKDGYKTSVFDMTEISKSLTMRLVGRYCMNGDVHILEQSPRAVMYSGVKRAAVMVRTHLINTKLWELWVKLADNPVYDTYLLLDETNKKFDIDVPNLFSHTVDEFINMGLCSVKSARYFWYLIDLPLYAAATRLPQYEYYAQIEFDVEIDFRNSNPVEYIVEHVIAEKIDFTAPYLSIRDENWMWTKTATHMFAEVWGCLFPFCVISARAANELLAVRRHEEEQIRGDSAPPFDPDCRYVFGEALVPSHLSVAKTYKLVDVNEIMENFYRPESFHPGMPVWMDAPFDNGELSRHPAMGLRECLDKHIQFINYTKNLEYLFHLYKKTNLPIAEHRRILDTIDRILRE